MAHCFRQFWRAREVKGWLASDRNDAKLARANNLAISDNLPGATETLKKMGCKMVTRKMLVLTNDGSKILVLIMALPSKHQHIVIKP